MIDNLNYYRAFYMVASTGSISKAAERLFISQPAVSKSVKLLEDELGIRLFNRVSRGVELTDEGRLLYDHLRKAFDTISKAEDELEHISSLGIGELRLGISTSLCRYILMPHLKSFIAENPHIKLTIDCHSTYNTIHQLQDGNIDVGFICETNLPPDYTYQPYAEIHDTFIASESYLHNLSVREGSSAGSNDFNNDMISPLFMAGNVTGFIDNTNPPEVPDSTDSLSYKDILERSNLMLLDKTNITRKHIEGYFYNYDINPSQVLEINNMDLLIDFASIGMGVSAVVREFALEQIKNGTVMELESDTPIPSRTVGFIYRSGLSDDSPTRHFIDFVSSSPSSFRDNSYQE